MWRTRSASQAVLVDVDDLLALIHAGFQADMVRTDHFARVLVFNDGGGFQRVVGTAHIASRLRCLSFWNSHGFILFLKFNQVHYIRKNSVLGKRNSLFLFLLFMLNIML
jgi:hypothetical protein